MRIYFYNVPSKFAKKNFGNLPPEIEQVDCFYFFAPSETTFDDINFTLRSLARDNQLVNTGGIILANMTLKNRILGVIEFLGFKPQRIEPNWTKEELEEILGQTPPFDPKDKRASTFEAMTPDESLIIVNKEIDMSLTTLINAVQTWNNGIDAVRVFDLTKGSQVKITGLASNGAFGNVDGIEGIISHDVKFFRNLATKKVEVANLLEAGKSNLVIFPFERSNAVFYYLSADSDLANEYLVVFVGNKDQKEILDQQTPEENLLDNSLLPTMLEHVNFAINGYVGRGAALIRANTKLTDDDKLALSKGIKKLLIEQQG